MNQFIRFAVILTAVNVLTFVQSQDEKRGLAEELSAIPAIERKLPPMGGVSLDPKLRAELEARVDDLADKVWGIDYKSHAPDAGALVKAVDLALKHGEFYSKKEIPVATEMLDLAEARQKELDQGDTLSWIKQRGLVVRGYRSRIDDSYQPFGLFIPEGIDLSKPVPMLVWLHGRGDKVTDLHFLKRCLTKSQAFGGFVEEQVDAIILYPFGRQCVGWKHAGEIDLFEAIDAVAADYPIDRDRVALAGFSMGGAGAWHIGAHYRDRFCAIHAGAGFTETKEYQKLTPEEFPSKIEQTLWQAYDVPNYVRNFFNGPLLVYSGSEDKQRQGASLMERELAAVGYELRHLIGEGMGHKYNQESVDEIWAWLQEAWKSGRPQSSEKIFWQTPTLRYSGFDWLELTGLERHWVGAQAEGTWDRKARNIKLLTKNISALTIKSRPGEDLAGTAVVMGNQKLKVENPGFPVEAVCLIKRDGKWAWGDHDELTKRPGLQGPIDDAFMSRFVLVPPDTKPSSPVFARWVEFEMNHFKTRWQALMRGQVIEKRADALDSEIIADANLILWGDPESNSMIAEIIDRLPIEWDENEFTFRGETYSCAAHAPVFIFPNPVNPKRYVVINSGLTFREGHDRTNSLQNPKLGDWAVIGLDQFPDAFASGRIVEAGFFDEYWK